MDNRVQLLTIAYEYLLKQKKCSLKDICNHVKNELQITDEKTALKIIGNLYLGIINDIRFCKKNDNLWYPRSEVSLDEIKEHDNAIIIEEQNQRDEFDLGEDTESIQLDDSDIDDGINIVEDSYDDGDIEPVSQKKEIIDPIVIE